MQARAVTFFAAKLGNELSECEDGAAWNPGDPATGRCPRVAVADGATGGFSSGVWAAQLVTGFVGPEVPALEPDPLRRWLAAEQGRWASDPRWVGLDDMRRRSLARGSFATMLGCELRDLAGSRPHWAAFALGDTVLFHVREHRLLHQFPQIAAEQFGYNPDGVPTEPRGLAEMAARIDIRAADLRPGDLLFLATDALAHWMISVDERDPATVWTVLEQLDHPDVFAALVDDHRSSGLIDNDDVTLMRVHLTDEPPAYLVVCL